MNDVEGMGREATRALMAALKLLLLCLFGLIKMLAVAIRQAALILCKFSSKITLFFISAAVLCVDVACLPKLYEGFSRWPGDITAVMPTFAIIVLPLTFVVEYKWYGLLASGMLTLMITGCLLATGWIGQMALVCGTLMALTFYKLQESKDAEENDLGVGAGSVGDRPAAVHGEPDVRPAPVDSGTGE